MNNFLRLQTFFLTLFIVSGLASFGATPFSTAKDSVAKQVKQTITVINTKSGDKAFAKLKFEKAIAKYKKTLQKSSDTVLLIQKIANAYRELNNTTEAEKWYAKIADNATIDKTTQLQYAEVLSKNQNYTLAKKYYAAAGGTDKSVAEMDKIPALTKDYGAYKIEGLSTNTAKADYAPSFYKDNKLMFTSNRKKKKAVYDTWSANQFSKVYIVTLDSTMKTEVAKIKANGKTSISAASYVPKTGETIYSSGSFKKKNTVLSNGKRVSVLKINTLSAEGKTVDNSQVPSINMAGSSNTQPSLSKDANTLYFVSDRTGGFGGTDIYIATRTAGGVWSQAKNAGSEINTKYDEKFPFIAEDGALYFSSNKPSGLGGLDVYKSLPLNGQWTAAENLAVPINSNSDDYGYIIDGKNQNGFFTSDRAGGMGEDDIYKFSFDESKLSYKVTVRVIDDVTQKPLPEVTLALDCNMPNAENSLSDLRGEKTFTIKGGKSCSVDVIKPGYKMMSVEVAPRNRNGVVVAALKSDAIKVNIVAKEKETNLPLSDITIAILPEQGAPMNYGTNANGALEVSLTPAKYTVSSPGYPSIKATFSEADVNAATGMVTLAFEIPTQELVVNVSLTANCFSSDVMVTDLATGLQTSVAPNTNGELRLDLKTNNTYVISHEGKTDTLSTKGVAPGEAIEGPCKFFVGQTWIVRNIYYDLAKWNIRPDAAKELDNLVQIMKKNPTLEIELGSHTDCRSGAPYNMVLSARRARAAVDYIVSKGIKLKRIMAAGYGEIRILNNCACEPQNESPCTDEQHQQNRRTEVKVIRF